MCQILALFFFICILWVQDVLGGCSRIPKSAIGHRSAVDENFKILIDGNPEIYIPGYRYNVSLSCPSNLKFSDFTLVVENEDQSVALNGQETAGHFELVNDLDTKFSVGCENIVESTNTNAKIRVEVAWVAPSLPDSGCILIKAGVVQHREAWFIDDGFLTKRICAEEIDELNILSPALQNCCACDEAKYEIVLERKWGKNTHPRHFPEHPRDTRIGEIIGASHTHSYRYWAYGELASEGMQKLAEYGVTSFLEKEIIDNTQNGEVRTMIKAPGIEYRPNVFGTTLANARVDPKHHQISLAAKVDPSPDWVIGVSGLELCLSNCTWLERKVLNLYPWDIGTDSGPSYMSPDKKQDPPDVIRHISSSYPSDYRTPFFDDTGAAMKPLATLYITRKKLYIRECEEAPQDGPLECATHPWIEWSSCSTRCGSGISQRIRSYKNPTLAANYNCDRQLEETRQCEGTECGREEELNGMNGDVDSNTFISNSNSRNADSSDSMAKCQLTNWSGWSSCSKLCGVGTRSRTRDFYNQQAKNHCLTVVRLPLEDTQPCTGTDCGGNLNENGQSNNLPESDTFGEITNNNPPNSWDLLNSQSRSGMDRNNQNWNNKNNNLSPLIPTENQRVFNDNRRPPERIRNPNYVPNDNYNRRQPEMIGNQNYAPNENYNRRQPEVIGDPSYTPKETYNQPGFNNNRRQPDLVRNYNYLPNQNQQRIRPNNDPLNNPELSTDFSTRAPFSHYPPQQSNGNGNGKFKVVQDYCYEIPLASTTSCLANPVIERNYWFYDHYGEQDDEGGKCKIFTTDNCDQNRNRFVTLEACEGTCILPMVNQVRGENDDGANNYQSNGGGFGQPMSQIRSRFNNLRSERFGN